MTNEHAVKLVGISGSLRAASWNTALLRAAASALPPHAALEIADVRDVPLYDQDLEADDFPAAVTRIKDLVQAADGLVIATPEYNGGIPGVAKNTFDWLSRPIADQPKVLHGKPVCLMGATPGPTGTSNAQVAWLPILRTLRMPLWTDAGSYLVRGAHQAFTDGTMTDATLNERLTEYLAGFVDWVAARLGAAED